VLLLCARTSQCHDCQALLEIPPFGGDVVNVLEHAPQQRILMAQIVGFVRQDGGAVYRQAKRQPHGVAASW
jgi:hypothetical protein